MSLAQTILDNARAELAMAILYGNEARELVLRRTIAEALEQSEPIDPTECYSVHTVVIDA